MSIGGLLASALGGAAQSGAAMADKIGTEKRENKKQAGLLSDRNDREDLIRAEQKQDAKDAADLVWERQQERDKTLHSQNAVLAGIKNRNATNKKLTTTPKYDNSGNFKGYYDPNNNTFHAAEGVTGDSTDYKLEKDRLDAEKKQLDIDNLKAEKDQAAKDKRFQGESAISSVNDMINTGEALLSGDGLSNASGASSMFPTFPGSDAADFEARLETYKSQAFLFSTEKMKGLGSLGEKEGAKMQDAIGSLSTSMSPELLSSEINRINNMMRDVASRMREKYGMQDTRQEAPDSTGKATVTPVNDSYNSQSINVLVNKYAN